MHTQMNNLYLYVGKIDASWIQAIGGKNIYFVNDIFGEHVSFNVIVLFFH